MTWFEAFIMAIVALALMVFAIGYFAVTVTMLDSERLTERVIGGILLGVLMVGVMTAVAYALGNAQ